MFDFLRNITKSAEEKRQEQLHAYVSGSLNARERQQFETLLDADADLRADADALQQLRQQMRQMPQRRVPRNFTLDPALYSKPARQPLFELVPAMRVATVLTAVFLVIAIAADFGTNLSAPAADVAMAPAVMEESAADTADLQQYAAEEAVEEEMEMMEEEVMEEEAMADDGETANDADAAEMADPPAADAAVAVTMVVEPTPTPSPTATPSTPRIMATEAVDNRSLNTAPEAEEPIVEETAVALIQPTAELETDSEDVIGLQDANGERMDEFATSPPRPLALSPLRIAQIGLGIILIGLLMLLRYARMQP